MQKAVKIIQVSLFISLVNCFFTYPLNAKNIGLHVFEKKCYTLDGKETLSKKATCFDLGKLSFADAIENFAENAVAFKRGKIGKNPRGKKEDALGIPDSKFVSLGRNGHIVIRFKDNVLVDRLGDDLQIFTDGNKPEAADVSISSDGKNYFSIGKTKTTKSKSEKGTFLTKIDIAKFLPAAELNKNFSYVKIIDRLSSQKNVYYPTVGVDINAVGAIHSDVALRGFCQFSSNSNEISSQCHKNIRSLIKNLTTIKHFRLAIEAYTDNKGSYTQNLILSNERAEEIRKQFLKYAPYLKPLITVISEGENNPLQGNDTEIGRSINRRVDLILSM